MSNVIKAPFTKTDHSNKKIIEVKNYFLKQTDFSVPNDIDEQTNAQMMIEQAKREAELIKQEAEQYYHSLKQHISQEQEHWKIEKQQLIATAQQEGYEVGLRKEKKRRFIVTMS